MTRLILVLVLVFQLGIPLAVAWPVMSNFAGGSTATPCSPGAMNFALACNTSFVSLGVF